MDKCRIPGPATAPATNEQESQSPAHLMLNDSFAENYPEIPTSERCQSGVEGLDDILGGGLPRGGVYLKAIPAPARPRSPCSFCSRACAAANPSSTSRFPRPGKNWNAAGSGSAGGPEFSRQISRRGAGTLSLVS